MGYFYLDSYSDVSNESLMIVFYFSYFYGSP